MPLKMFNSRTYGDVYYLYQVTLYPHSYFFFCLGGEGGRGVCFKEKRSFSLVILKCNNELKCIPV